MLFITFNNQRCGLRVRSQQASIWKRVPHHACVIASVVPHKLRNDQVCSYHGRGGVQGCHGYLPIAKLAAVLPSNRNWRVAAYSAGQGELPRWNGLSGRWSQTGNCHRNCIAQNERESQHRVNNSYFLELQCHGNTLTSSIPHINIIGHPSQLSELWWILLHSRDLKTELRHLVKQRQLSTWRLCASLFTKNTTKQFPGEPLIHRAGDATVVGCYGNLGYVVCLGTMCMAGISLNQAKLWFYVVVGRVNSLTTWRRKNPVTRDWHV